MHKLIIAATLGLATVAFGGASNVVLASGGKSGHSSGHNGSHGGFKSFDHKGQHYHFHTYYRHYKNWSHYCWFPSHHCYGYFCPTQCCWYYWYAPYNCYLPCSYMTNFAPTPVPTSANINVNTNVNNNNSPGLPTGGAPVPTGTVPFLPGNMK
jgi:hypothetical protein